MESKRKLLLKILNINCYLTDEAGFDDIYLVVDDQKIWPTDKSAYPVKPGKIKIELKLSGYDPGTFLEIEIWDFDYFSSNDLLGKVPLFLDEPGGPYNTDMIQNMNKTQKAKYSIDWEIDFM